MLAARQIQQATNPLERLVTASHVCACSTGAPGYASYPDGLADIAALSAEVSAGGAIPASAIFPAEPAGDAASCRFLDFQQVRLASHWRHGSITICSLG